jgi:hypothetical protein
MITTALPAGDIYVYDHHSFVVKGKVFKELSGRAIIDGPVL